MRDIDTLVAELSRDVPKAGAWQTAPTALAAKLLGVLAVYGLAVQVHLGLRPDLGLQFSRIPFDLEITLLVALALGSVIAAVIAMYPDAYQKPGWLKLPYAFAIALILLVLVQFGMPSDARMIVPPPSMKEMDCTLCIASVAVLPSALLFAILMRGASVRPMRAGSFAVLAASAIGCLTLRLAEANDSLMHLALWHYLPTLIFATLGALIGSRILKW